MNVLFFVLFCLSLVLLLFSAPQSVLPTILASAEKALALCISIAALYCVWMGVMHLLSAAGVHRKLARLFHPLLRFLLGETEEETENFITLNLSSNLLGLGSAATPAGLEAVKRMEQTLQASAKENAATAAKKNAATAVQTAASPTPPTSGKREHAAPTAAAKNPFAVKNPFAARLWYEHQTTALFLLNTCMLQLLPTGIISLRASLGSKTPSDVLLPSLLCGAFSLVVAILVIRLHKGWTVRRICNATAAFYGKKGGGTWPDPQKTIPTADTASGCVNVF
jgi:spore maturation protein A